MKEHRERGIIKGMSKNINKTDDPKNDDLKGIYLCAKEHRIPGFNIDYNDITNYPGINICCDMLKVDIEKYDYVIATPPCNYYSRANYRRETSKIAQSTKHLLPGILKKLENYKKPFLVENVCNSSLLPKSKFLEFNWGNHHFYTNVLFFIIDNPKKQNKQHLQYGKRDNNYNVHTVINAFLERIKALN